MELWWEHLVLLAEQGLVLIQSSRDWNEPSLPHAGTVVLGNELTHLHSSDLTAMNSSLCFLWTVLHSTFSLPILVLYNPETTSRFSSLLMLASKYPFCHVILSSRSPYYLQLFSILVNASRVRSAKCEVQHSRDPPRGAFQNDTFVLDFSYPSTFP